MHGVDLAGIAQKAISDSDILANFNLMIINADIKPDSHVSKDVLYGIIKLYIRVRAFSVAKDVIRNTRSKQSKPRQKLYARRLAGAKLKIKQGRSDVVIYHEFSSFPPPRLLYIE